MDLATTFQIAVASNIHEGIANYFSAVLPDGNHFLVDPFGLHFSEITASHLIVCDFSGNVVRGEGIPSPSAHYIYAPVHRLDRLVPRLFFMPTNLTLRH